MKLDIKPILFKSKTAIKNVLRKSRDRFIRAALWRLDKHEEMLKVLADANFRTRAMTKNALNKPINVLFICHEPSLWGMFDTVYKAMEEDNSFAPLVVALPYQHRTLPEGQYKDAGMFEYCKGRDIKVIRGYDRETDKWLSPAELMPDYVFFQTPYHFLPTQWCVEQMSMMARVCYIPYATLLSKGAIAEIVHPEGFFKYVSLFFSECQWKKDLFIRKYENKDWFNKEDVVISGHPKLDYLSFKEALQSNVLKRGVSKKIIHILWTPRWNTSEGNCHFFDYKDFFDDFCKHHQELDFVFRPHPLCFQNFIKTGEMSLDELQQLKHDYDVSLNMRIDENAQYEETFVTSDILISDLSTMMLEYFATGKPIIYTLRKDPKALFNEYGLKLSEGLYLAYNSKDLTNIISKLLSGEDPLRQKREELRNVLFFMPEGGAGRAIKDHLSCEYKRIGNANHL